MMKNLLTFITENKMNDLYISILNYLNDWEVAKDEQSITKVYNICHTLHNQKLMEEIFETKKLSGEAIQVVGEVIEKYGAIDYLNGMIKNPISFSSLPMVDNIFDIIEKTGNKGLNFWKDLAGKQPKIGKNPVGPFELLLIMILKDAVKSESGDVKIGEINIEVKSGEGRCELRDNKKSPETINTYLNQALKKKYGKKYEFNLADNKTNIKNAFNSGVITPEILAASLFQQYTEVFGNWEKSQVYKDFLEFIKDIFENIIADPGNELRKIYGILNIYCYAVVNKHDYLMIFSKVKKKLTGDYLIISKNDTFKTLYDNEYIVVQNLPRCKDSRSYFPQLNCAKNDK